MDFIIECKITPGMELFEQQYFTEQYIILTRTEERREKDYTNLNFSVHSCTHVHHKYSMTKEQPMFLTDLVNL